MRSLNDINYRWSQFLELFPTLDILREAARHPVDRSPATATLRSICWKSFLLNDNPQEYPYHTSAHESSRAVYTKLRDHCMRYIDHPEDVISIDPLADNPESPWAVLRQDEDLRAEIRQDVERCMQDQEWFRLQSTQDSLVDVLFVYCKANPDIGYRQGMHELLAPLFYVMFTDSIDLALASEGRCEEEALVAFNSEFIEHDSYLLFSIIMQTVKSSYAQGSLVAVQAPDQPKLQNDQPSIVERSKHIHEVLLWKCDPELAVHLTTIEILPQIFLIRWIRLLFGREFVFQETLDLWDNIFAHGLTSNLVDMICVAMLLRIRWELLESDYSTALGLLLRYPEYAKADSPLTFVEDALCLQENSTQDQGIRIIHKRTNKAPRDKAKIFERPSTPEPKEINELQANQSRVGPGSPSKGLDNLLQGAARGVLNQGERWGLNKAVREAVGEVRRNVQTMQLPSPSSSQRNRASPTTRSSAQSQGNSEEKGLAAMMKRNARLAAMLETTCEELRTAVQSSEKADGRDLREAAKLAVAKVDLVRLYLEDKFVDLQGSSKESQDAMQTSTDGALVTAEHESVDRRLLESSASPLQDPFLSSTPPRNTLAKSSLAWMLGEDDHTGHGLPSPGLVDKSFSPPSKSAKRYSSNRKAGFLFGDDGDTSHSSKDAIRDTKGTETGPL